MKSDVSQLIEWIVGLVVQINVVCIPDHERQEDGVSDANSDSHAI